VNREELFIIPIHVPTRDVKGGWKDLYAVCYTGAGNWISVHSTHGTFTRAVEEVELCPWREEKAK
jgi:hypothetical protein